MMETTEMASLYRKPIVKKNPKTGAKTKTYAKKWWGQYKDAQGKLKRVPLAIDKMAAQAMLAKLVQRTEREVAGLVDPTEDERKRPVAKHLEEFKSCLRNKGVTAKSVGEISTMLKKIAADRKWKRIGDISASGTLEFLGQLRRNGLSAQTYNHYLKAAKQFTRWLVSDRRTPTDPLVHLKRMNVQVDRRHDRRPLSREEFVRVLKAARTGNCPISRNVGL